MGYLHAAVGLRVLRRCRLHLQFHQSDDAVPERHGRHVDVATSWSFSDAFYVGAAGYFFSQVSPDTGGSPLLGDFRSRVAGAGPQVGWSFQLGGLTTDLNLRGYKEFAA